MQNGASVCKLRVASTISNAVEAVVVVVVVVVVCARQSQPLRVQPLCFAFYQLFITP